MDGGDIVTRLTGRVLSAPFSLWRRGVEFTSPALHQPIEVDQGDRGIRLVVAPLPAKNKKEMIPEGVTSDSLFT